MVDIITWVERFSNSLEEVFPDRVWFIGLQGSYGRDEATDSSDIDMVVILDKLSVEDIQCYNTLLDTLPNRELICGFLSGKDDLMNWEASDLFQFYHDTKPIKGNLDDLLPRIDENAVNKAIKTGVCNIYHACVHNMLYEKDENNLFEKYSKDNVLIMANKTVAYIGRVD